MIAIELVGGPLCGEVRALDMPAPPPDYRVRQSDMELKDWTSNAVHPASPNWTRLVYRRTRAKPGGVYVYEFDPTLSR